MLYCEKLRELREKRNLKLIDISKILDIDDSVYGRYEREYQIMPVKHLNVLCNCFGVSFDYIFGFTNIKQYDNSLKDINLVMSGERLKEFRRDNKLTQNNLAKILNSGRTTITSYEKGIYIIATPFLYTICSKYKISADYLLGKIDDPKYLK
ncbi:MAG: helix-turn-helix domain-containing protein [Ruminococcus sp.]|nr:helix-turn-helix domain-containing protein [Ruminococcus sp.]